MTQEVAYNHVLETIAEQEIELEALRGLMDLVVRRYGVDQARRAVNVALDEAAETSLL